MNAHDKNISLSSLRDETRRLMEKIEDHGARIFGEWEARVERPEFAAGARNLADYLAFRQIDLTGFQDRLASIGLSSLGRAESHVAPALQALSATLGCLTRETMTTEACVWPDPQLFTSGLETIARAQARYFGEHLVPHATRIMVTLPAEAADDPVLVRELVLAGAGCVRINCAHDDAAAWKRMIGNVREAAAAAGRTCPVIMDLGGPKIRVEEVHLVEKRLHRGDRFRLAVSPKVLEGEINAFTINFPGIIERLTPGAPVLINDGKIGARVAEVDERGAVLEVTLARAKGEKLKPEKGVNFPSIDLEISPLTDKDYRDLDFVAANADVVGFSFVQRPSDIDLLVDALAERRAGLPKQPLMLKIETALAVKNLPRLLVSAGGRHPVCVMIARGDLAMEAGLQRLSEIQEEILWLCEAAHVPVAWATQVLESLVKDGAPSRAEVTDAAMGQRAECVMLNKGPFIVEGVRFLADVLHRMDRHQFKKTARLAELTSWRGDQSF